MMGTRSRRRGKPDRTSLVEPSSRKQQNQRVNEVDPDHELIYSHPPSLLRHRSRRAMLQQEHLAFASIDPSQFAEKRQYAGMSSAAACIVLELPTMIPLKPSSGGSSSKKQPSVELLSNNRKRRTPVPNREVTKWRNSTGKACYRFKPVYTHQFFTDEVIQGYRPTESAFKESLSVSVGDHHPSFAQNGVASHTLSIQVRLAPSCRKCCLIVEVGKSGLPQPLNEDINSGEESLVVGRQAKSRRGTTNINTAMETTSYTRSTSCLSDGVSWDGDDEDDDGEFELKNQGGKKRRRSGTQTKTKKTDGATAIPTTRSTRGSRRKVGDFHKMDSSESLPAAAGKRRRVCGEKNSQPTQLTRQPPRLVTDVSDGQSSDEEMGAPPSCEATSRITSTPFEQSLSSSSATASPCLAKMKMGTIITQVSAGLPEVAAVLIKDENNSIDGGSSYKVLSSSTDSTADIENDYLNEPMGDVIREYSREKTSMSLSGSGGISGQAIDKSSSRKSPLKGEFILSLADMRTDKDARKYHDEVEKISQWFIEIASCVEVGVSGGVEPDGGYWKVLYLFEKHRRNCGETKYSLVGYVTLFYHGPQMTVCQAVCLPPYQRSGHGTEMLMAAYEVCESREILVESPAPAFVALRNRVDYALVSALIERTHVIPNTFSQTELLFGMKDCDLPDDVLIKVGSELHITPRQVETAFDIWKLGELEKAIQNAVRGSVSIYLVNQTIASMEATYKAMLKRSLLKTLRVKDGEHDFGSMDLEEQKEYLEECFNAAVIRYWSILK